MVHHRTTTLHVTPHYKPSQFTETPTKQAMTAAEEAVLTKILALLPNLPIFGRNSKCFHAAVSFFLVLALNRKLHLHPDLFNSYFFICCLTVPRLILDHCQEDNLNHLMLITVFLSFFESKVTGNIITMSF